VKQSIRLIANVGEIACQDFAHLGKETLARLDRFRHQEQLDEVLVAELLVERQIEPRRAFADEGPCVGQIEVCRQHLLQALCFARDLFEPGSFWQPQVDQNFRAIGGREELFWDETEARNADQKRTNSERDDETPPANASRNDRPNDAIGPAVEGAMLAGGPATRVEPQIADPG